MTTSTNSIVRLAAFLVLFAVTFATPAITSAQLLPCRCKTIGINVSEKVACAVTICVIVDEKGNTKCVDLKPGSSVDIPCPSYGMGIQLCNGEIAWVIGDGSESLARCTRVLQVAPKCCVQACFTRNEKTGCPEISIIPAMCLSRDCLKGIE